MRKRAPQKVPPAYSPADDASAEEWNDWAWQTQIADWPLEFMRILIEAGFKNVRVRKEAGGPVWLIRMEMGRFDWPATDKVATKHLQVRFRDDGIDVAPTCLFRRARG